MDYTQTAEESKAQEIQRLKEETGGLKRKITPGIDTSANHTRWDYSQTAEWNRKQGEKTA